MYAGHFAAALALRAKAPRAPFWALLAGAAWLDLLHGALVLAAIERVHPDGTAYLGYRLDYLPWSHSLVAALVWSGLAAALFAKRGRDVAIAVGLAVFSHWALDALVHEHDLPLAPGLPFTVGLNLWGIWPLGAWLVEGAIVAAGVMIYLRASAAAHRWRVALVLAIVHLSFAPPLNPLHLAGEYFSRSS